MSVFCTIITHDYIPYAFALHDSLLTNGAGDVTLYVLIAAHSDDIDQDRLPSKPGVRYLFVDNVCSDGLGKRIKEKYFTSYTDGFRWSMKPVLINYLIQRNNCAKVIYVDCDIFFFSSFDFLFEKLDSHSVIITPHWRASDPAIDPANFEMQYNSGLFNGGFIAASSQGTAVMDWWAKACEYICVKDPSKGHFVDQTHLNLMPVFFDGVEILKHRGCNIASWNRIECRRETRENGQIWINGEVPVVFVHFTGSTIRGIVKGQDAELFPYLNEYSKQLEKHGGPNVIERATRAMEKDTTNKSIRYRMQSRIKKWLS